MLKCMHKNATGFLFIILFIDYAFMAIKIGISVSPTKYLNIVI